MIYLSNIWYGRTYTCEIFGGTKANAIESPDKFTTIVPYAIKSHLNLQNGPSIFRESLRQAVSANSSTLSGSNTDNHFSLTFLQQSLSYTSYKYLPVSPILICNFRAPADPVRKAARFDTPR